jgi:hypothetical protein
MATLFATLDKDQKSLEAYADAVNNGSTSDSYFYVNGHRVSVSNPYYELSEETQLDELNWFCQNRRYQIEKS